MIATYDIIEVNLNEWNDVYSLCFFIQNKGILDSYSGLLPNGSYNTHGIAVGEEFNEQFRLPETPQTWKNNYLWCNWSSIMEKKVGFSWSLPINEWLVYKAYSVGKFHWMVTDLWLVSYGIHMTSWLCGWSLVGYILIIIIIIFRGFCLGKILALDMKKKILALEFGKKMIGPRKLWIPPDYLMGRLKCKDD